MKIKKNLILWAGIFLVISLLSGFGSSATSEDIVTFFVGGYNESDNNSFDGYVSNLEVESRDEESISWIWENSEDEDFFYNLIFLDYILVGNGTFERFDVEDLDEDECYEISIISIGANGNEGPLVSDVGCTLASIRKGGKNTGMGNDVIPNFYVSEDNVPISDVMIVFGSSSVAPENFDLFVLTWWIFGLLIFGLLAWILVLLRR